MKRLDRTAVKSWGFRFLLGGLLGGLISCNSAAPPNDEGTVEFWTMQLQPQFTDYFDDLIADFEAQNPDVTVRWVDVPWSAMEAKILTAVSAKTAPDVANLNPTFSALLAGRNAWLDLDDRVPEATRQRYLANIWDASRFEDQSFGIPWYLTTRITIYNTDLLNAAGLETPPTTYDELARAARQIKDKTGKYAFFITVVPDDSGELLESFVQMGVQLIDDTGKAAFNSPEGKKAFEYWVKLYRDGLLPRDVVTQGHQRAIELYQAGELAFLTTGPQFFQTIAKNAPSIAAVSKAAPQITGETGKIAVAVMNVVIPRDTNNPEAAVEFALFLTNADNQLAFSKAANTLPSTIETLQDGYFQSATDETTQVDDARVISAEQLQRAEILVPPIANVNELQKIIYDNLQAAMLDEKTVDRALADAEAAWNALER
ncbi:MAG: sugar ABC transporter substrate-binding protein [Cyanobacteria bacterium SID2]|nr:sugar ABC transporter substrate-binding protein [Cyanobacteria bacterium SID2]MBP0004780.1 sugar ABC transporter substrate-binding protein [Cyanobacteria bacterium SBC]